MLDRERERRAIEETLNVVRGGFSEGLVLRGSGGVGKTTLVEYAISSAGGFKVCTVDGVESEIELEFAALHQLLIPFLPGIDDLPPPQAHAVKMAFGLETGKPPDALLVGLACLTLVSRAAEDHPVLCVVDDAHWIDAESARVLGFVARRLYADRVAMILTVGDTFEPASFEPRRTIDVGGLPDDAAAELLRSVVRARLQPEVVKRVLADTGGNPLALVEVASQYGVAELSERTYGPEPVAVGTRLQRRYLQGVRRLPAEAQEFVLLVAADRSGDRALIRRAAADASIDVDAAEEAAETANLIEISGNEIRFRHPLIRSAIYGGATDANHRRAHRLLSGAHIQTDDSERQTWHRAAAAAGPDEGVAADLQAAAERATSRGAWTTAAGLLRRSIAMTADAARRARREVGLAQAELVIGHPDVAEQVAGDALPRLPDEGARGRAKTLRAESLFAQGRSGEAADLLLEASASLGSDPAAAADAMLSALDAAIWAGSAAARRIANLAVPPPLPIGSNARASDLLLAGYRARFIDGYDAAALPLRDALAELRAGDVDPDVCMRWCGLGVKAAGSLWDDEAMIEISERWVRTARRLGALTFLPVALAANAFTDWLTGRFDQAGECWDEMRELTSANRAPGMFAGESRGLGLLQAYRGDVGAARANALGLIGDAIVKGHEGIADMGRSVLVVANLFAGEPEAAIDAALPVIDHDPAFTTEHMLPELVEAGIRAGDRKTAEAAFAALDSRARTSGTKWALGLRARALALVSDGDRAEEAYAESISYLERSRATIDLARARLVYGQWLRRGKRRREARRQLRVAESMYDAMGAAGMAAKAREELSATGERARPRTPDTERELTAQESRVAHLATEGATNSEIAARLFISPSTVEYHLAKVYRKLGIRSRSQLANKLPSYA